MAESISLVIRLAAAGGARTIFAGSEPSINDLAGCCLGRWKSIFKHGRPSSPVTCVIVEAVRQIPSTEDSSRKVQEHSKSRHHSISIRYDSRSRAMRHRSIQEFVETARSRRVREPRSPTRAGGVVWSRRTVLSACTRSADEPRPCCWKLLNVDYLSENGETTLSHHKRSIYKTRFRKRTTSLLKRGLEFTPNSCQTSESKGRRIDANYSRASKTCLTSETIEDPRRCELCDCGSRSRSPTAHEMQGLQIRNHDKQPSRRIVSKWY